MIWATFELRIEEVEGDTKQFLEDFAKDNGLKLLDWEEEKYMDSPKYTEFQVLKSEKHL